MARRSSESPNRSRRNPGSVAGRGRERKIESKGDHDLFVPGAEDSSVARGDWQQSGQGAAGGDADAERLVLIGAERGTLIDMEALEDDVLEMVEERERTRPRSLDQPRKARTPSSDKCTG